MFDAPALACNRSRCSHWLNYGLINVCLLNTRDSVVNTYVHVSRCMVKSRRMSYSITFLIEQIISIVYVVGVNQRPLFYV